MHFPKVLEIIERQSLPGFELGSPIPIPRTMIEPRLYMYATKENTLKL